MHRDGRRTGIAKQAGPQAGATTSLTSAPWRATTIKTVVLAPRRGRLSTRLEPFVSLDRSRFLL
jgi:hypothetical protein